MWNFTLTSDILVSVRFSEVDYSFTFFESKYRNYVINLEYDFFETGVLCTSYEDYLTDTFNSVTIMSWHCVLLVRVSAVLCLYCPTKYSRVRLCFPNTRHELAPAPGGVAPHLVIKHLNNELYCLFINLYCLSFCLSGGLTTERSKYQ